jgi:hypothetical protein
VIPLCVSCERVQGRRHREVEGKAVLGPGAAAHEPVDGFPQTVLDCGSPSD